jgi:hypothetical protein
MDSILDSIKKMLGLADDYDAFDIDILIGINSALMTLNQCGIGPTDGYVVTGRNNTWSDFLGSDRIDLEAVKMYVYVSTRMLFDPPASSSVASALENTKKELEWRLNVQVD